MNKKDRKIIAPIAFLIIGIVIGVVIGYGSTAVQIGSLQNQINALQSDKIKLQEQVSSLENDKAILQAQIIFLQDQVASLQSNNTQLRKRITELEISIAAPSVEILSVKFSPKGGCASEVIYWIGRANESVHVLIYSFTLNSIGDAILEAYQRGIDVKIVFEESQNSKYSEYFRLVDAGIQVRNDTNPSLMHHKVAVIDGSIVLVGSFNWSNSAEEDNNENLLVIRSFDLASSFEKEFQRIWITGI